MSATGAVTMRGEWPGLVVMRAGWWKAFARPLNDESPDATIRVERGSSDFVERAAGALVAQGVGAIHSPPMMPGTDRMFTRAGFRPHIELRLLERDLRTDVPGWEGVHISDERDREQAAVVDNASFEGEWRVGRLGLADALEATPDSTMISLDDGAGFAIVGVAQDTGYLQRIAVHPDDRSAGRGRRLLRGSMAWARNRGAKTMMLNTQLDNDRAAMLYRSEAFRVLPTRLTIHRFEA